MCIGRTDDLRAVWQNDGGKPFIILHDAQGKRHFCTVTDFDPEPNPTARGEES